MFGFNPFDLDVDQSDEDEDMLVMNLSSLHMSSVRNGVDASWISRNTHKDLVKIINKYNDFHWLSRGQHNYCIFYAVDILGLLGTLSKNACLAVLNEPGTINSLLCLWRGDMTWFEQRVSARAICAMFLKYPDVISKFLSNDLDLNIVKLAVTQYTECIQKTVKRCMIVLDRYPDGYVQDLVVKVQGHTMDYSPEVVLQSTKNCIISWKESVGGICIHFAKFAQNNKKMLSLFESLDVELYEKAVAMDLCYIFLKEKDRGDPDTFMDALICLTENASICRMIMMKENIIKALILKLRARDTLSLRYDLIISNLLRHGVIPIEYYYDLCVSLMSLLNASRITRCHDRFDFSAIGSIEWLFDTTVNSLKMLFGMSLEIEYLETEKTLKSLKCRKCRKMLCVPYKIPCGHRYCYNCVQMAEGSERDSTKCVCFVKKCNKMFTPGKQCSIKLLAQLRVVSTP